MSDQKDLRKVKGHMALRNNVYDLKLELWRILKPLEYYLVDVIIDKTIKWREKEAKITIKELKERTGQHHSEIYRALKGLETKRVIVRRKHNHDLIIGLNEEFFGELLIKKHADALLERKKKIKIVVDNSKKVCATPTASVSDIHESCRNHTQDLCETNTENINQDFEIIEEKRPLNTLLKDISLNTSLKDNKISESSSPFGRRKIQLADPIQERDRQIAEARKLGIL